MSRLFSRLARQAMGRPHNPVRPVVAQPFESHPDAGISPLAGTSKQFSQAQLVDDSAQSARQSQQDTSGQQQTDSEKETATTSAEGTRTRATVPPPVGNKSATQRRSKHTPTKRSPVRYSDLQKSTVHQPSIAHRSMEQAGDNHAASTDGSSAQHSAGEPMAKPGATQTSALATNAESVDQPMTQYTDSPQPLLPKAQDKNSATALRGNGTEQDSQQHPHQLMPDMPSAMTGHAGAAVNSFRQQAVKTAPDEVHVHIGRIEVRAVSDSKDLSAKRSNSKSRKTLSLEDYLAQRRTQRS